MKDMWMLSESQVVQMTNDFKRKEFLQTYRDWCCEEIIALTGEAYYTIDFLGKGTLFAMVGETIGQSPWDCPTSEYVEFYYIQKYKGGFGTGRAFRGYKISEHAIVQMLKDARKEILEGRK